MHGKTIRKPDGFSYEIDTFMPSLSTPRNRNLADVLYRLELVKAISPGIPELVDQYQGSSKRLQLKTTASGFMITLSNLGYGTQAAEQ